MGSIACHVFHWHRHLTYIFALTRQRRECDPDVHVTKIASKSSGLRLTSANSEVIFAT